ncbi:MAG TPA: CaiB/BaiF CoA-transferase family protein [Nitrososphaerales archaeon]|nr:CaiB/BaiF CoA-transferase family protein [Nitrososphaerales archaeon]
MTLLDHTRVLEVSHAVAGPTVSQVLADYGAEVLKIEKPDGGDIFRNVPGMGPTMFLAVNRGKKSVAIDLKKSEGLAIFYELVGKTDVIIENLGPGVAEKLGIYYDKIRKNNVKAIYCKIESFGKGPYENTPAFDPILQASVGIMSTTGFPPDHFARAGVSMVDMSTGLHAAVGILALLLKRTETGRGAELRVSLYDAAAYYMSYWAAMYDLYGRDTFPLGSGHIFGSPYNLFRTKDGFVYVSISGDSQWQAFCRKLGFSDLLKEKKYERASDRVARKKALERLVASHLSKFKNSEIESRLRNSGVPFGKFNTVASLLKDPHFLERDLLKPYKFGGKRYRTIVNPSVVDGSRFFAESNPPKVGEDTEKILKTILGYDSKKINLLRSKGAIN